MILNELILELCKKYYVRQTQSNNISIIVNKASKLVKISQDYNLEIIKSKLYADGRVKALLRVRVLSTQTQPES